MLRVANRNSHAVTAKPSTPNPNPNPNPSPNPSPSPSPNPNPNPSRNQVKATPSRKVNATLDTFFAPYNAQLYAWMEMQGRQFKPWD